MKKLLFACFCFYYSASFAQTTADPCDDIERKVDKFTNEITYTSPILEDVVFVKSKKIIESTIYMAIRVVGTTLSINKKGFTVLLENDKRIEKPTSDIDVTVNQRGTGYVYTAMEPLSAAEIKLLAENAITDARLYIYDGRIVGGNKFKEYLKCIISK